MSTGARGPLSTLVYIVFFKLPRLVVKRLSFLSAPKKPNHKIKKPISNALTNGHTPSSNSLLDPQNAHPLISSTLNLIHNTLLRTIGVPILIARTQDPPKSWTEWQAFWVDIARFLWVQTYKENVQAHLASTKLLAPLGVSQKGGQLKRVVVGLKGREGYFGEKVEGLWVAKKGYLPAEGDDAKTWENRVVFLYFHGGGYCTGNAYQVAESLLDMSQNFHKHLFSKPEKHLVALSLEYPLAPENPHPAPLHAVLDAYKWLVEDCGAKHIVIGGDSAGGHLVLTFLRHLHRESTTFKSFPPPIAAVGVSPWVDIRPSVAFPPDAKDFPFDILHPHYPEGYPEGYVGTYNGGNMSDPMVNPSCALEEDLAGGSGELGMVLPKGGLCFTVGSTEALAPSIHKYVGNLLKFPGRTTVRMVENNVEVGAPSALPPIDVSGGVGGVAKKKDGEEPVELYYVVARDMPHIWHMLPSFIFPEQSAETNRYIGEFLVEACKRVGLVDV
ncbi:hypothetical protein HK102_004197 [Quaeritorhiza haematococci]|nr:hypothetical protein HK102_004197 [Quaeritorhiza haematococci]